MQIAALRSEAQQRDPRLAELTAGIAKRQEQMTAMEEQINKVKDSIYASFSKQASYMTLLSRRLLLLGIFASQHAVRTKLAFVLSSPQCCACCAPPAAQVMQVTSKRGYSSHARFITLKDYHN